MVRALRTFAALLAVAAAAGCTVSETNPPALVGPSELGLSLTLTARPDVLTQDGSSQAQIEIQARDQNGQPKREAIPLRVEITVGGLIADYGTLSPGKNVSTGSDGRAVITYTAPPASLVSGDSVITLTVTPVGTDYITANPRTVNIRLVPPGIITGPGPNADFLFSPTAPVTGAVVQFDASLSAPAEGQKITVYAWDFGDGDKKVVNGSPITTHDFMTAGTFVVSLTVTDSGGSTHTVRKTVTIS